MEAGGGSHGSSKKLSSATAASTVLLQQPQQPHPESFTMEERGQKEAGLQRQPCSLEAHTLGWTAAMNSGPGPPLADIKTEVNTEL